MAPAVVVKQERGSGASTVFCMEDDLPKYRRKIKVAVDGVVAGLKKVVEKATSTVADLPAKDCLLGSLGFRASSLAPEDLCNEEV